MKIFVFIFPFSFTLSGKKFFLPTFLHIFLCTGFGCLYICSLTASSMNHAVFKFCGVYNHKIHLAFGIGLQINLTSLNKNEMRDLKYATTISLLFHINDLALKYSPFFKCLPQFSGDMLYNKHKYTGTEKRVNGD